MGTQQQFPPIHTLTTTFKAIQNTFRSLEMHSKQRYKICICSDIVLGGTRVFRNFNGFSIIFPENFSCNLTYYETENFSNSSLHHIFESENFRFPFFYYT